MNKESALSIIKNMIESREIDIEQVSNYDLADKLEEEMIALKTMISLLEKT